MKKALKYLYRLVLSVVVAVILYLLFISNIARNTANNISLSPKSKYSINSYPDLDKDGNSEKIQYFNNLTGNYTGFIVYTKNKILDQWNFTGRYTVGFFPFYTDYDKDGTDELFFPVQRNDTVFLNVVDPINRKVKVADIFIDRVYKFETGYDFTCRFVNAVDVNADGIKETFMYITTGYSKRPRKIYSWFPLRDTVYRSPESCAAIGNVTITDLDKDNIPEIMPSTVAIGNCRPESPYSDMYNWLMVYTPEMKFKFPPIRFDAYPGFCFTIPMKIGNSKYILVMNNYRGQKNYERFVALYDAKGELVKKKNNLPDENFEFAPFLASDSRYKNIYTVSKEGTVFAIDSNLNFTKITKLKDAYARPPITMKDIDLDGQKEYILRSKEGKRLIICRNDFNNPLSLDFGEPVGNFTVSVLTQNNKAYKVVICTDNKLLTFSYELTFLYQNRYLLFLIILTTVFFIDLMTRKIIKYRKLKIKNAQKKITELQIKSIQNQIDPYFTYNIVSAFEGLVEEKDTKRADELFNSYAGLLKTILLNTDKIQVPLSEEINFVETYLELEKFRYADTFNYKIEIENGINTQTPVPRMLLHIFIENLLNGNLKNTNKENILNIKGRQKNGNIEITLENNFVQTNVLENTNNKNLIDKILKHYYQLYKVKIYYEIEYNNEKNCFLKIEIPVK